VGHWCLGLPPRSLEALLTSTTGIGTDDRPRSTAPPARIEPHYRVRKDKVDITGVITLRHNSRLHHIGIGRRHVGTRVLVLVADLDVRVLTEEGELLRELTLDPTRDYQPHGRG